MATAAAGVKAVATGVEMGMAAVTAAAKWPVVEPLAAPAGAAEVGLVEAELPLTKHLPFFHTKYECYPLDIMVLLYYFSVRYNQARPQKMTENTKTPKISIFFVIKMVPKMKQE